MFTGIIEQVGEVVGITEKPGAKRFMIQHSFANMLAIGESVSIDGACQTVLESGAQEFTVESMQETLNKTILSTYREGSLVNLERSLQLSGRLSGHLVSGHVDATGTVEELIVNPDSRTIVISYPNNFGKYLAPKGNISVNGISLTVIAYSPGQFEIGIIPYTWDNTNLNQLKSQTMVNLEFDLIAKYLEEILSNKSEQPITFDFMRKAGW